MKLATTICGVLLASALGGCAMSADDVRNMTGFPVDPACADFYGKSPLYGGNRALAYATNCSNVGM